MKEKIIDIILAIPLSNWKGCKTSINGMGVEVRLGNSAGLPYININGIALYDSRIGGLYGQLREKLQKESELKEQEKLENILSMLTK